MSAFLYLDIVVFLDDNTLSKLSYIMTFLLLNQVDGTYSETR